MAAALPVELLIVDLPTTLHESRAVRVGVQLKKDVPEAVAFAGKEEISFRILLQVETNPLRFKCPAVQGPAANPFLYLSWGDWSEGAWAMAMRTKVPLSSLPLALLETALANGQGLRARLFVRDARGRLATGTLKPNQIDWSLA